MFNHNGRERAPFYSNSINILVYRPGYMNDSTHPSEAQIGEITKWYVERGTEGMTCCALQSANGIYPEGADLIDLFIRNDGDLDYLGEKVDKIILPYVKSKFDGENLCCQNTIQKDGVSSLGLLTTKNTVASCCSSNAVDDVRSIGIV